MVRLLKTTFIRVGNEEYAKENSSFGLTTLRNRHVSVEGGTLRFRFRGKSGQMHDVAIQDKRLARIVRDCRDLPGYELFQYTDESGDVRSVDSSDVNAYLHEIACSEFRREGLPYLGGNHPGRAALAEIGACTCEDAC